MLSCARLYSGMRVFFLLVALLGMAQGPLRAQSSTVTNQPQTRAIWAGGNVTFAAGVSNTGPFSYQWLFNSTNLANAVITTVAGKGIGDGGAATNASLQQPHGMAVDSAGSLYFADYYDSRIRKVSTNGTITTVAGMGPSGYNGDNINATNACLYQPTGVALDTKGNVFIADYFNNRIRKVTAAGIITTVAGNGATGYSGDGRQATNASLNEPHGVKVDAAGNLFIADRKNNCIRKVNSAHVIATVAGNGSAGYSGDGGAATNARLNNPFDVTVDGSGNIFIADTDNQRIRKVNTKGIITTVAGNGVNTYFGDGGAATNASLHYPEGVTVDATGNLYIGDENNLRVRKVNTKGIISTVAGNGIAGYFGDGGAATNASLFYPKNVVIDTHSNLFIADAFNNRIRKVNARGIITTIAGEGLMDNGPATNANFCTTRGVAVDASGDLFVVDYGNSRIREVKNNIIFTVVGTGAQNHTGDGGAATNATLYQPSDVTVDGYGNLFIADFDNECVRKVDTNGIITTVAGNGTVGYSGDGYPATNAAFNEPVSVAVDAPGNLFISDFNNNVIRKVDTSGIVTTVAGTGNAGYSGDNWYATQAYLNHPRRVAIDAHGNQNIADSDNNVIRQVDTSSGFIYTVAGNGTKGYSGDNGPALDASLDHPTGLALDGNGNMYVADDYGQRVRHVDINGIITTIAGNGVFGFSGDGGPPTSATLANPAAVAVDPYGNVFIADLLNNRVRKVSQGTTLALTNLSTANAGLYQMVVIGPGGSVTNTIANLIVAHSPLIYQTVRSTNGSLALDFVSQPSTTNVVQYTTNLSPPVVWHPLWTNKAAANGNWQFTDTNAARYPSKYYRSLSR
jgi:hypothetical protein